VAGAVKPVIAEILADHEQHHRGGCVERDREQPVPVGKADDRGREAYRQETRDDVFAAECVGQRGEIGPPIVVFPHHHGEE
jgi:hypothetical protein